MQWLIEQTNIDNISVIARWQKNDLLCGASDFSCYEFCKSRKILFGVATNLHGKVFSCDNHILVGSSNLTSKGLALSENHNDEFGVGFEAGEADEAKIQDFLSKTVWVDDYLANILAAELDAVDISTVNREERWSLDIQKKLDSPIVHLWVHDLLFSNPEELSRTSIDNENCAHDLALLNLSKDEISIENLQNSFVKTNAYKWLSALLDREGSLSFGKVTAELHNALLDDPSPYRQDVKKLVANLFSWAEALPSCFKVIQPRYSLVLIKA